MSKYLGDFSATSVIDFKFTTFRPSTGAPFTLAGTPAVSVYKDNDITQSTAGVTLTVDFDGVTGLHHVRITTASDATFYANGGEFECVITTGTVDAVSVVGSCIGRFTLRSQASLYPTTAGNTLDVNANGEAGIDWANVGGQATTVGLANTTIAVTQQIASVSGSVNSVTNGVTVATNNDKTNYGLASGAISTGTFSAGAINAAAIADGAIDAGAIADDAITSAKIANSAITIRLDTDGTVSEARLVTGTVASDVWNALVASYVTANTFGARIVRVRSTSPSNEAFITGANHIASDVHEFQPAVISAADFADSALVIGNAVGTGVKAYLNTSATEGIADTLLNRNIAGGGNGTGGTLDRTVRSALRALRNRSGISGSTLTVYTEDDTATAWTASVSTTAGANPVTGIDPTGP